MTRKRQLDGAAHVYKRLSIDPTFCFYCSEPSASNKGKEFWDHQPPRKYRREENAEFWKVPCCKRCNQRLGAVFTRTLEERFHLAEERGIKVHWPNLLWLKKHTGSVGDQG